MMRIAVVAVVSMESVTFQPAKLFQGFGSTVSLGIQQETGAAWIIAKSNLDE